jgi:hypothetical protein
MPAMTQTCSWPGCGLTASSDDDIWLTENPSLSRGQGLDVVEGPLYLCAAHRAEFDADTYGFFKRLAAARRNG